MSSSKLSKPSRQHENTWRFLHKRLVEIPFSFEELFEPQVWQFLHNKAASLSTSVGYLVPCIIATTAFIASCGATISNNHHQAPMNLFILFVGPPTTGKSQAVKEAAVAPIVTIIENADLQNFLLEKCTSSALAKVLSDVGKGFVASPEIFDFLNKLLKSDDENATGDAQLFCELFSGERASYRYATEKIRYIEENTPFTIVGATQVPFAAKIISRMDQGHGLLDRFLVMFPSCFRPSMEDTAAAHHWLADQPVKNLTDIFLVMQEHYERRQTVYKFSDDANLLLTDLQKQHLQQINDALRDGLPTPKCKMADLVQRVSAALHIFNHFASELMAGRQPTPPPSRITARAVSSAEKLVNFADSQKQITTDVSIFILCPVYSYLTL